MPIKVAGERENRQHAKDQRHLRAKFEIFYIFTLYGFFGHYNLKFAAIYVRQLSNL